MAELFDLDGPVLAESRIFTVIPARGGGWGPLRGALARLLTRATQAQAPKDCEHVLATLQVVYGFTDKDPVVVVLDPFR
jgi:hypothetical protein